MLLSICDLVIGITYRLPMGIGLVFRYQGSRGQRKVRDNMNLFRVYVEFQHNSQGDLTINERRDVPFMEIQKALQDMCIDSNLGPECIWNVVISGNPVSHQGDAKKSTTTTVPEWMQRIYSNAVNRGAW